MPGLRRPGTGKTYTVVHSRTAIEQPAARLPPPHIDEGPPARRRSRRSRAGGPGSAVEAVRAAIPNEATTIHRAWCDRYGPMAFRRHRGPLRADLVAVTKSMVDVVLMALLTHCRQRRDRAARRPGSAWHRSNGRCSRYSQQRAPGRGWRDAAREHGDGPMPRRPDAPSTTGIRHRAVTPVTGSRAYGRWRDDQRRRRRWGCLESADDVSWHATGRMGDSARRRAARERGLSFRAAANERAWLRAEALGSSARIGTQPGVEGPNGDRELLAAT
jgi:hypothetical protein